MMTATTPASCSYASMYLNKFNYACSYTCLIYICTYIYMHIYLYSVCVCVYTHEVTHRFWDGFGLQDVCWAALSWPKPFESYLTWRFMGSYKSGYKYGYFKGSAGFRISGLGFRVVISPVISPLIWVITLLALLMKPLTTTHEPPSTQSFTLFAFSWKKARVFGLGSSRHRLFL